LSPVRPPLVAAWSFLSNIQASSLIKSQPPAKHPSTPNKTPNLEHKMSELKTKSSNKKMKEQHQRVSPLNLLKEVLGACRERR
jgi:hypothetical protein